MFFLLSFVYMNISREFVSGLPVEALACDQPIYCMTKILVKGYRHVVEYLIPVSHLSSFTTQ